MELIKKKCNKCLQEKDLFEFNKESRGSLRLRPTCRECASIKQRENREKNTPKTLTWGYASFSIRF